MGGRRSDADGGEWAVVAGGGAGGPAVQHSLNYSSTSEWGASDRRREGELERQAEGDTKREVG